MESNYSEQQPAFLLKGGNLTLTTLELLTSECSQLNHELSMQTQKAPAFFKQTPVVLSFERLGQEPVALEMIVDVCKRNGLLPIAVRCAQESIKMSAWALGMGWFPPLADVRLKDTAEEKACIKRMPTKFVRGTIRSGQQIYASCADLVVIGSVNEGAEVIADGNVQIWGVLRGRAIAGAQGDPDSRILCQQLRAELVSIAGVFQTFDAKAWPDAQDLPLELRLENDRLIMA